MRFISPLRYPGGKGRLAPYISTLMSWQDPLPEIYAEPFAGGAGVALKLLVDGDVDRIHINDLNPGIAAFWRAVFDAPEEFADMIDSEDVSLDAWHRWRDVYLNPEGVDDLSLGFATFFLNRTNRSGILTARPIGGLDQAGTWKIDARFNRPNLSGRVRFLGDFAARVTVTELDARVMIRSLGEEASRYFVYVDPPYLVQGDQLYMSGLSADDHQGVADALAETDARWLLTYDADARVTATLYATHRCLEFDIRHNAHRNHLGQEYAVFAPNLVVPDDTVVVSGLGRWIRAS
jgi:DNA adenine methylase